MNDTAFPLPDLGEGLEEATIVTWHVAVGDDIALNQPLCTVETAKAEVEIPSPYAGRVVELGGEEGDTIDVGALLVRMAVGDGALAAAGPAVADATELGEEAHPDGADARPAAVPEQIDTPEVEAHEVEATASDTDGRAAVLVGYGPATEQRRSRSRDRHDRGRRPERPRSTPPVRKLARDLGIDIADLHPGSGPGGRITRADVESAAAGAPAAAAPTPTMVPPQGPAPELDGRRAGGDGPELQRAPSAAAATPSRPVAGRTIPLTGIRARIAAHMTRSRSEIPEATSGLWVDAGGLLALRERLQEAAARAGQDVKITPFAVLLRMVLVAVRDYPTINATIDVDEGVIRLHDAVHLGIATQTERGLLVPVIRDAHRRSTLELATELQRLATAAREGSLLPAELVGSTLTVTNFGAFGVDDGNPVINHPEAAIVGVGSIKDRPWVVDGELAVRPTVKLVCAFDHRVSDGAEGGGFLRRLGDLVERPDDLLLHL